MPKLDLQDKINNMLDEIPDYGPNDKRREHTISRHDARWLANLILVIVESGGCNRGLTENETASIKSMIKERRRMLALVGTFIVGALAYIGQKALDVLDSSFWKALFARISH